MNGSNDQWTPATFQPFTQFYSVDVSEQDATRLVALRGRLTLIPLVNEAAYQLGRRTAEDGLDLARTCPGPR